MPTPNDEQNTNDSSKDSFFASQETITKLEAAAAGVNAYTLSLEKIGAQTTLTLAKMVNAMIPDADVFNQLEKEANKIQRSFGLSRERVDEFKNSIANVAPELIKMGMTEDEATTTIESAMKGLGTAASLSKEAIVELAATTQVTGVQVETLASNFRDVGISVYDVGDRMKEVTEIARGAGVSVAAVAGQVTSNLGKMNIYNFDNGVKGLAKMAATGERLGITMDKVFVVSEKAFNPEGAIEMSAALQRMGVTASGLLDPLRAMDMAQNDPEALQKEIVSLGKEFTRFNETTGQMEILPGAKRRMREVADAVGMSAEEFASMALKAGDFEMKLKQIKMPSLAEGDQETKELIASMAQMKDGVAKIEVRNKETGVTETKRVEELTPEDIENLKKANEDSSKSIEDIAVNQLDVTTRIEKLLESGVVATKFATATSPTLSKFYGLVAETKLETAKTFGKMVGGTEDRRKFTEGLAQPVEGMITGYISGDDKKVQESMELLKNNFTTSMKTFSDKLEIEVGTATNNVLDKIKQTYDKPIQVENKTEVIHKHEGTLTLQGTDSQRTMDVNNLLKDPNTVNQLNNTISLKGVPSSDNGTKNR